MSTNSNKKNIEKLIVNQKEASIETLGYVPVSGYLVLFDIVNSTSRKEEYRSLDNNWLNHFNIFYKDFSAFANNLINKVASKVKEINDEELNFIKEKIILKTIGDIGFLFLPFENQEITYKNKKADPHIAQLILEEVIRFLHSPSAIPDLKLKTIITYLYEVYLVAPIFIEGKTKSEMDIVGKGVDFTFRLEKFANSSCCILNKYFFEAIDRKKITIDKEVFNLSKVKKNIRSWEEEEFYFLTNEKMIESAFESTGDKNSIYIEIFSKYIKYKRAKNFRLM